MPHSVASINAAVYIKSKATFRLPTVRNVNVIKFSSCLLSFFEWFVVKLGMRNEEWAKLTS